MGCAALHAAPVLGGLSFVSGVHWGCKLDQGRLCQTGNVLFWNIWSYFELFPHNFFHFFSVTLQTFFFSFRHLFCDKFFFLSLSQKTFFLYKKTPGTRRICAHFEEYRQDWSQGWPVYPVVYMARYSTLWEKWAHKNVRSRLGRKLHNCSNQDPQKLYILGFLGLGGVLGAKYCATPFVYAGISLGCEKTIVYTCLQNSTIHNINNNIN